MTRIRFRRTLAVFLLTVLTAACGGAFGAEDAAKPADTPSASATAPAVTGATVWNLTPEEAMEFEIPQNADADKMIDVLTEVFDKNQSGETEKNRQAIRLVSRLLDQIIDAPFSSETINKAFRMKQRLLVPFRQFPVDEWDRFFHDFLALIDRLEETMDEFDEERLNLYRVRISMMEYCDDEEDKITLTQDWLKKLDALLADRPLGITNVIGKRVTLEGVTADGKSFHWSDYDGKVVLIDFWTTSCGNCLNEMPKLTEIYHRYRDQGFEIVGVCSGHDEGLMRDILTRLKIEWVTLNDMARQAAGSETMAHRYPHSYIPYKILIGRDGTALVNGKEIWGENLEKRIRDVLVK